MFDCLFLFLFSYIRLRLWFRLLLWLGRYEMSLFHSFACRWQVGVKKSANKLIKINAIEVTIQSAEREFRGVKPRKCFQVHSVQFSTSAIKAIGIYTKLSVYIYHTERREYGRTVGYTIIEIQWWIVDFHYLFHLVSSWLKLSHGIFLKKNRTRTYQVPPFLD